MEQARRDSIIESAVKAFSRFGFRKASIDDIAREAGVAKGTVYLACESKEDLFYQALHREVREWTGQTSRAIDRRAPADETLALISQLGLDQVHSKPLVGALLSGEAFKVLPRWRERINELRQLCSHNIVEVLELGIQQKRFCSDLDVKAIAELLLDLQVTTLLFHNEPGPEREARLMRRSHAAFQLILQGIRTASH